MNEKLFKLVGAGVVAGATAVAKMAGDKGWRAVMASEPPSDPKNTDARMWETVAWAAVSGALISLAQVFATRKWAQYVEKSTGEPASDEALPDSEQLPALAQVTATAATAVRGG